MKHLINKSHFFKIISDTKVPSILTENIKEFSIGKNYFYELTNQQQFAVQNTILKVLTDNILLNNASIAFRKNLSYLHLFEPHRKNYNFLRLDIRSFFHSIPIDKIKEVFKVYIPDDEYIDEKKIQSVLDAFINLVTYKIPSTSKNEKFKGKRVLPMGFQTSPIISNIVFRQLDILIQKLCSSHEIVYTRYADDMLFSSSKNRTYVHTDDFIKEIRIILSTMDFKLNEHKTLKARHTLSLNGYTIQYSDISTMKLKKKIIIHNESELHELRLSHKKTDIVKKIIHMIVTEKKEPQVILKKLFQYKINLKFIPSVTLKNKYSHEQLLNKILGYRSYLISIIQFNKLYYCTQDKTIDKYIKIINDLEKIATQYRIKIEKLERQIDKEKKRIKSILMQPIDKLQFTIWEKDALSEVGYTTLNSLKGVTEKHLYGNIKGIGEVKAKKIVSIVNQELSKTKSRI